MGKLVLDGILDDKLHYVFELCVALVVSNGCVEQQLKSLVCVLCF